MGRRSLRPPLFFAGMQCRSKCYGGWQNGETCDGFGGWERVSLIPCQLTCMQRLRRGMKVEVWEAVL